MNTYAARYKFSQLHQASGESVEDFIARITCVVSPCDYNAIPNKKLEEILQIQQIISCASESRFREALLVGDVSTLAWTLACDTAKAQFAVRETNLIFNATELEGEIALLCQTTTLHKSPKMTRCYRCGSTHYRANFCIPVPHLRQAGPFHLDLSFMHCFRD
ncbi:hypothetical protein FGIG_08767 [Fasciola gigantica]|uniref:Uncharacterized protein n=1 Tax=Fasciola gigantica TaxID=46835 RepID=A0A504YUC1_FASGI|nr:hypothetical protein FGIG_08767 [Fasciola gigantica]